MQYLVCYSRMTINESVRWKNDKKLAKTNNTRDSPVVTDLSTSLALYSLIRAERTGSHDFCKLWSFVKDAVIRRSIWTSVRLERVLPDPVPNCMSLPSQRDVLSPTVTPHLCGTVSFSELRSHIGQIYRWCAASEGQRTCDPALRQCSGEVLHPGLTFPCLWISTHKSHSQ